MNGGRRPGPHSKREVQINPQTRRVQDLTDEIAEELLTELKSRISARIKAGDLKKTKLPALVFQLTKLLNGIKKPASTLNMMVAPQTRQIAESQSRRDSCVEQGVELDESRLLRSQEEFLRNHDEVPR